MKLIIDIPEDEVNECKRQVETIKRAGILIESLSTALKIYVANGTPLPKGHRSSCRKRGQMTKKSKNPCLTCDCWDSDAEGCTMPHSDKWYACPIESAKPENQRTLEEMSHDKYRKE